MEFINNFLDNPVTHREVLFALIGVVVIVSSRLILDRVDHKNKKDENI